MFDEEEVISTIKDMNGDTTCGPHGFFIVVNLPKMFCSGPYGFLNTR